MSRKITQLLWWFLPTRQKKIPCTDIWNYKPRKRGQDSQSRAVEKHVCSDNMIAHCTLWGIELDAIREQSHTWERYTYFRNKMCPGRQTASCQMRFIFRTCQKLLLQTDPPVQSGMFESKLVRKETRSWCWNGCEMRHGRSWESGWAYVRRILYYS